MDLKAFKTDETKEQNGVWIDIGDGGELLIASANNPAYRKAARKIPDSIQRDQQKHEKRLGDIMAQHVLLDWRGMTDEGKPVKPTLENRKKFMAVHSFRELVASHSLDISNFQNEDEASDGAALKSEP